MKKLFQYKKNEPGRENCKRKITMMMPSETMIQREASNKKSEHDHDHFKREVVNDIYSKQWKTAKE